MERVSSLYYLRQKEYCHYHEARREYSLAGYTWDMMRGLHHKAGGVKMEHDGCVNSVKFTPDGSKLISGSDDKKVKIWDMYDSSPKLLATVKTNHIQNIFCADICPHNENWIVSCAGDGTLRLNDIHETFGLGDNRSSNPSVPVLSKETRLVRSSGIIHMFTFDVDQPHVLYTAEDRGIVRRVDLRAPRPSASGDTAGDGAWGGPGGGDRDVIFRSCGRDPATTSAPGSVKAVTQSSFLGGTSLFVGGAGLTVGLLDLRMVPSVSGRGGGGDGSGGGSVGASSGVGSAPSVAAAPSPSSNGPTRTEVLRVIRFFCQSADTMTRRLIALLPNGEQLRALALRTSGTDAGNETLAASPQFVDQCTRVVEQMYGSQSSAQLSAGNPSTSMKQKLRVLGLATRGIAKAKKVLEEVDAGVDTMAAGQLSLSDRFAALREKCLDVASLMCRVDDSIDAMSGDSPGEGGSEGEDDETKEWWERDDSDEEAGMEGGMGAAPRSRSVPRAANIAGDCVLNSDCFVKKFGPQYLNPRTGTSALLHYTENSDVNHNVVRYWGDGGGTLPPSHGMRRSRRTGAEEDSDGGSDSDSDSDSIDRTDKSGGVESCSLRRGPVSAGGVRGRKEGKEKQSSRISIAVEQLEARCARSKGKVSISGLQCSTDGSLLLASYQGDQIYTFNVNDTPVNSGGASKNGLYDDSCWGTDPVVTEKLGHGVGARSVIGGHINFATFLKTVSFFGPRDEYIVSGSDSGCLWIWDASSGQLVGKKDGDSYYTDSETNPCHALNVLAADSSTCNGVIPHPRLPLLASYGIDSDIKLWQFESPAMTWSDFSPAKTKLSATTPPKVSAAATPSSSTTGSNAKPTSPTGPTSTALTAAGASSTLSPSWYLDSKHSVLRELPYFLEVGMYDICSDRSSVHHNNLKTKMIMSCTYTIAASSVQANSFIGGSVPGSRTPSVAGSSTVREAIGPNHSAIAQMLASPSSIPIESHPLKIANSFCTSEDWLQEVTLAFGVLVSKLRKDPVTGKITCPTTQENAFQRLDSLNSALPPPGGASSTAPAASAAAATAPVQSVAKESLPVEATTLRHAMVAMTGSRLAHRERKLRALISSQFRHSTYCDQVFDVNRFAITCAQLRRWSSTINSDLCKYRSEVASQSAVGAALPPLPPSWPVSFVVPPNHGEVDCLSVKGEPGSLADLERNTPDFPTDLHGEEFLNYYDTPPPRGTPISQNSVVRAVLDEMCALSPHYCGFMCGQLDRNIDSCVQFHRDCAGFQLLLAEQKSTKKGELGSSSEFVNENSAETESLVIVPPNLQLSFATSIADNGSGCEREIALFELIANIRQVAIKAKEMGTKALKAGDLSIALSRYEKGERYFRVALKLCAEFMDELQKGRSKITKKAIAARTACQDKVASLAKKQITMLTKERRKRNVPGYSSEAAASNEKKNSGKTSGKPTADKGALIQKQDKSKSSKEASSFATSNSASKRRDSRSKPGDADSCSDDDDDDEDDGNSKSDRGGGRVKGAESEDDFLPSEAKLLDFSWENPAVFAILQNQNMPIPDPGDNLDAKTGKVKPGIVRPDAPPAHEMFADDPEWNRMNDEMTNLAVQYKRDFLIMFTGGKDLVLHNKCAYAIQAMIVDCMQQRKLCYSNEAAVCLQLNRYEDAYVACAGAIEVIKATEAAAAIIRERSHADKNLAATIFPTESSAADAKIYFRLGCAACSLSNHEEAIKALHMAIAANGGVKDAAVARKLSEAVKLHDAAKKKEAKKYAGMFS